MKTRIQVERASFQHLAFWNSKPGWKSILLGLALFLACLAVNAQTNYSINWSTIDGGGGTSTGGVYAVTGTIGQPDAGAMSGGNYTLEGGFWSVLAIQTPGAPFLQVVYTSTNTVVVSWPLPATGWVLEQTNALPPASVSWPQVPNPYVTNSTDIYIIVPPPVSGHRFYRLFKP